jgi:hypothetical protein
MRQQIIDNIERNRDGEVDYRDTIAGIDIHAVDDPDSSFVKYDFGDVSITQARDKDLPQNNPEAEKTTLTKGHL